MRPPQSDALKELVRLYGLARHGEYNLAAHLSAHPELLARLGIAVDLTKDDAELGLALAPAMGKYKGACSRAALIERDRRAEHGAARLVASSRPDGDRVVVDAGLLLGAVSGGSHDYFAFELEAVRVAVPRRPVARGRVVLRGFLDLAAYVDATGLHLRWRAGRGGLNIRPQLPRRDERILLVDLRRHAAPQRAPRPAAPVLLADVLADLGLM